jgi:CBS domain-containing protein
MLSMGAGTTRTVADAMVRRPKSFPLDAAVREALAAFENPHVHMLLLTDGRTLNGTIIRSDLTPALSGAAPLVELARLAGRTASAEAPLTSVRERMIKQRQRRLAVIDPDRTLLGLLCLKRTLTGFCTDDGIEARARDGSR